LTNGWEWKEVDSPLDFSREKRGYLYKQHRVLLPLNEHLGAKDQAEDEDEDANLKAFESQDKSVLLSLPGPDVEGKWIIFDLHILYSSTYQVPVLYFNAFFDDAQQKQLLSLEQLWRNLTREFQNEELRWTFLTQGEHPLLGIPFYFVHPCESASLLKEVSGSLEVGWELSTWLSLVGPIVHYRLPSSFFESSQRTTQQISEPKLGLNK
jgi:ubiquitin-like-conjugating enzyme ATG10